MGSDTEYLSKSHPHHFRGGGERRREVGDLFGWPPDYIGLGIWFYLVLPNDQRVTAATALFGRQTIATYISWASLRKCPNPLFLLPPPSGVWERDLGVQPSVGFCQGVVGVPASP